SSSAASPSSLCSPSPDPCPPAACPRPWEQSATTGRTCLAASRIGPRDRPRKAFATARPRSEEHTSELQSPRNLVCRLLLEKKTRLFAPDPQGLLHGPIGITEKHGLFLRFVCDGIPGRHNKNIPAGPFERCIPDGAAAAAFD